MILSNYSTPVNIFYFLLMFTVHQQSASDEIQEAGPSHHQQHSAAGVLQHYPPKIESQKKQMSIPMQCNYIVIEQLLFVGLQHLLRLRRLLMVRKYHFPF